MAAPQADVGPQLKQALFDSLTATLSPQQEVRLQGEDQLKVLEVTDGRLIFFLSAERMLSTEISYFICDMSFYHSMF